MLPAKHAELKEKERRTHNILEEAFKGIWRPLRSVRLDTPDLKDERTTKGWAFAIHVLTERFAQLPGILAERTLEDVVNAAKVVVAYVLKCYHNHDPNFNLETVQEGIATAGPIGAKRL